MVAAPMSPCRGSDIAFQPRCSRREARAAAPGKYRALLGLQPRPRPPPLPHHPPPPPHRHQHSGSHPRAPTAGPSAPHSTAILRATSALRCPARPPPSPPCIPQGRCATSPSQTAPRGGQVERAGWQLSPQVPSAPQPPPERLCQHPRVKLGHGDVGHASLSLPLPPPILRAPGAVPGVSRGCSPPSSPHRDSSACPNRQSRPPAVSASSRGGAALLSNHPLEPGEVRLGAACTHCTPSQRAAEPNTLGHSMWSSVRAPSSHARPHLGLCSPWRGGLLPPMHISTREAPWVGGGGGRGRHLGSRSDPQQLCARLHR